MSRLGRVLLFAALLTACESGLTAGPAATDRVESLPDWSGWWLVKQDGPPALIRLLSRPLPLRADKEPQFRSAMESHRLGGGQDDCVPPKLAGFQHGDGFDDALEFLFTPGRVTLTTEAGWLRRIATDGRALPADPDPTNMGTSVGHWDGQTLIVETVGLSPTAPFPLVVKGAPTLGEGAHLTEEIAQQGPDTLVIHSHLVAPGLFTAPVEIVSRYTRDRQYVVVAQDHCPEPGHRVDPVTGKYLFDVTPPADIR